MPGNERQLRPRKFAVDDVQVRAADAAGADADQHLPRSGRGLGSALQEPQCPAGTLQHHGTHGRRLPPPFQDELSQGRLAEILME